MNRWITNAKLIVTALAFLAAIATVGSRLRREGRVVGPERSPVSGPHADLAHHQPRPADRAGREGPLRPRGDHSARFR
jgi:hypothetical protein